MEDDFTPKQLVQAHIGPNSQIWAKMVTIAALFRASCIPFDPREPSLVIKKDIRDRIKGNVKENFSALLANNLFCYDGGEIGEIPNSHYDEPMFLQLRLTVQFNMTVMVSVFYFYIREADSYPFVNVHSYIPCTGWDGGLLPIEEVA